MNDAILAKSQTISLDDHFMKPCIVYSHCMTDMFFWGEGEGGVRHVDHVGVCLKKIKLRICLSCFSFV